MASQIVLTEYVPAEPVYIFWEVYTLYFVTINPVPLLLQALNTEDKVEHSLKNYIKSFITVYESFVHIMASKLFLG